MSLPQSSSQKSHRAGTAPPWTSLAESHDGPSWDLDEVIPEVKTSFFFDNLLPPCPLPARRTVKSVVRQLKRSRELEQKEAGRLYTWRNWDRPSASSEYEDITFAPFADLARTIQETSGITTPPLIQFKCNPASSLSCHTRMNTSKPDCYGVLSGAQLETDPRTGKEQPRWLDVAVPGEFKKGHSERERNDVSVPSTRFVPCSWSLLAI